MRWKGSSKMLLGYLRVLGRRWRAYLYLNFRELVALSASLISEVMSVTRMGTDCEFAMMETSGERRRIEWWSVCSTVSMEDSTSYS